MTGIGIGTERKSTVKMILTGKLKFHLRRISTEDIYPVTTTGKMIRSSFLKPDRKAKPTLTKKGG